MEIGSLISPQVNFSFAVPQRPALIWAGSEIDCSAMHVGSGLDLSDYRLALTRLRPLCYARTEINTRSYDSTQLILQVLTADEVIG
jgi:hypothetical protein